MYMYIWVALGGLLGTLCRYFLNLFISQQIGSSFPWGVLFINVTGSFAIGFFAALSDPGGRYIIPAEIRAFFMIGVCGGYTTFSSYSLQTLSLLQNGQWLYASGNILGSNALCLLSVWLGYVCATALQR